MTDQFKELVSQQPVRLPDRNAHPYHMFDMINATPDSLRRVIKEEKDFINQVAQVLVSSRINKILIVGIGTSYHCALNVLYFFEEVGGLPKPVQVWNSFDFVQRTPHLDTNTAVIILSHRGIKKFSFDSYIKSKEKGSYTVLITSKVSPVVEGLDAVIRTSIPEQSSAFTVSHSTSTLVGALLAVEIAKIGKTSKEAVALEVEKELLVLGETVGEMLARPHDSYRLWAAKCKDHTYLPFVGYLGNESNAHEVALKIKEAAWLLAEGAHTEHFIHGPFVAVSKHTALTAIISSNSSSTDIGRSRSQLLLKAAKNVGALVAAIVPDSDTTETDSIVGVDGVVVHVPPTSEPTSVFTNLIALQLLTYYISLERNTNPDTFRKDKDPLHKTSFPLAGIVL